MIVTVVNVWVKRENVEDFKKAMLENHAASLKEKGNMRFDVLQAREDPTRFIICEAYEDDEASREHKNTAHYKKWKETAAPWMAKPREGLACDVVAPRDVKDWR